MIVKKILFWLVWLLFWPFVWLYFGFKNGFGLAWTMTGLVRYSVWEERVRGKRKRNV